MLRLKMAAFKEHQLLHIEHTRLLDTEDVVDRIYVLRNQEQTNYACGDYLSNARTSKALAEESVQTGKHVSHESFDVKTVNGVDEFCREQIVEWSYRVVDYFHINREVVAVSTSYLDRFLAVCDCDRRTFKLAATTALYLAIKLNESNKTDMMSILSDLSRGEFSLRDIVEMEKIMMESLSWLLHPPTSSCFVGHMLKLIPSTASQSMVRSISALAGFFSELSLCDYYFTTQFPSTIALAAILNAIEILSFNEFSIPFRETFLDQLSVIMDVHYESQEVVDARKKLWHVYERSEESVLHEEKKFESSQLPTTEIINSTKSSSRKYQSPVCVSRK